MTESLFVDMSEAAALLGISDDLVRDMVARGELPAAEFGRRKKIPRRAIELVHDRALADFDPDRILARLGGAVGPSAGGPQPAGVEGPSGLAGPEDSSDRRAPEPALRR